MATSWYISSVDCRTIFCYPICLVHISHRFVYYPHRRSKRRTANGKEVRLTRDVRQPGNSKKYETRCATTLFFLGAIMQFLGVKSPLEENAEFPFPWNISRTVRDIEKKLKQKLHPSFMSTKPRKNNFRQIHTFHFTPTTNP